MTARQRLFANLPMVFLCIAGFALGVFWKNFQAVKALAQQNAALLADYQKSPFVSVTLDALRMNDGPVKKPFPDGLIYATDCDVMRPLRHAVVNEPMQVIISKEWQQTGSHDPIRLPAGSETFQPKIDNAMTPTILIGSNLPHGVVLTYETTLQDISRPSPPDQMQHIPVCVLNPGAVAPARGCPPQPPETEAQRDRCPVYTTPSAP